MDEYIDREELIRQIICSMTEFIGAPDDVQKHDEQCNYAIDMIEDAPAADVTTVRHARWKRYGKNLGECSECGEIVSVRSNYCPNCGAKMDGGNE